MPCTVATYLAIASCLLETMFCWLPWMQPYFKVMKFSYVNPLKGLGAFYTVLQSGCPLCP